MEVKKKWNVLETQCFQGLRVSENTPDVQRGVAMKNITGKLFQNIQSREVSAFE